MHRTRIKICGITRAHDALAAVEAGADAIGIILHANAPRAISREVARKIVETVPDRIDVVGVFVDADAALIQDFADELQLDQVQLHGNEPPAVVDQLRGRTIIKVIRDGQIDAWRTVRGMLFEPPGGRFAGGNGIEHDWKALAPMIESIDRASLVLAGGLRPDNVAAVVRQFRPWTVDVSSGVETAVGVKSPEKLREFCTAVRTADAGA
jgi:phosphoribosylanthranilate isomerase